MSGQVPTLGRGAGPHARPPRAGGRVLVGVALAFLALFIALPLLVVLVSALSQGFDVFLSAIGEPDALAAVRLSLLVVVISVPLNVVFGVVAAWLLSKYEFPGKGVLLALIDLPFSVSPVISGLLFVLLFGAHGWFGPWLTSWDVKVIFAVPGIILATTFVTFPLVARELLAVMQAKGSDEEEAALTLGASGWQILWRVTLPKVKWGLMYGVILCNARAMGEFGAVSVVSGHIRGETNTIPLHVEVLYNEYHVAPAFAVASLLALLALLTIGLKRWVEWRAGRHLEEQATEQPKPALDALPTGRPGPAIS